MTGQRRQRSLLLDTAEEQAERRIARLPLFVMLLLIGSGIYLAISPVDAIPFEISFDKFGLKASSVGYFLLAAGVGGMLWLTRHRIGSLRYARSQVRATAAATEALSDVIDTGLTRVEMAVRDLAGDKETPDVEIDEIRDLLDSHKPREAIALLTRIKERRWDTLTSKKKYRVLANLGAAYVAVGDTGRGAQYMLDAFAYDETGRKARVMHAYGLHLKGDSQGAFKEASVLRRDYPDDTVAAFIWLFHSDGRISDTDLASQLTSDLLRDADIARMLSTKAQQAGAYDRAIAYMRNAQSRTPDAHFSAIAHLGFALIAKVTAHLTRAPVSSPLLVEAIECLTRAEGLSRRQNGDSERPYILLKRAVAYSLAGDTASSNKDIEAAYALAPSDPRVALQYVVVLREREGGAAALAFLRRLRGEGVDGYSLRHFTALCLTEPDTTEAFSAALDEIVSGISLYSQGESVPLFDALAYAIHLGKASSRLDEVAVLLPRASERLDRATRLLLSARLASARGDRPSSLSNALEAASVPAESIPQETRRELARLLAGHGEFSRGLSLLKPTLPRSAVSPDSLLYCRMLAGAGDIEALTTYASSLRAAGVFDPDVCDVELQALIDCEHRGRAVSIAREYRAHADPNLPLLLAVGRAGIQLDDKDLLTIPAELCPPPASVSAGDGAALTLMLAATDSLRALTFAYGLVRTHFSALPAHYALINAYFMRPVEAQLPDPSSVVAGSAVTLQEIETNMTVTWVLEEEAPQASLSEIHPTDAWAKRLMGKKVGDSVQLSPESLSPRDARITHIRDRRVFRAIDCMENVSRNFPTQSAITQLRVPPGIAPGDLRAKLEGVLGPARTREADALAAYRAGPVPVGVVGRASGQSTFMATFTVLSTGGARLRVCGGAQEEFDAASRALESDREIAIDAVAAAVLYASRIWRRVEKLSKPLLLVREVEMSFRALERRAEQGARGGTLGFTPDGVKYNSAEDVARELTQLRAFFTWMGANSTVVEAPLCDPGLSPKEAEVCRLLGPEVVGTALLARVRQCLCWTDDGALAGLLAGSAASRVWTQAVLLYWNARGVIDDTGLRDATCWLVQANTWFVRLNARDVLHAAERAAWSVESQPLKSVIASLAEPSILVAGVAQVTLETLVGLRKSKAPQIAEDAIFRRMLETVGSRPDRGAVARYLRAAARSAFGLDVTAEMKLTAGIAEWR